MELTGDIVVTAYRGEHGKVSLQSYLGSFSFSDHEETARLYALSPNDKKRHNCSEYPRVITAELKVSRPIINTPTDPFIDFSTLAEFFDQSYLVSLAVRFSQYLEETNHWNETYSDEFTGVKQLLKSYPEKVNDLYMLAFPLLDDIEFVSKLKLAGFDGAIHAGYGENSCEVEYKVFSADQILVKNSLQLCAEAVL